LRKTTKVAVAGVALVLSGGAAAGATGSLPDAAQDGLSKASSHVGIELPASSDNHPEGTDADTATTEHPENHGADVSAVAQDTATVGRDHGEAVSEVARQGHGNEPSDASSNAADNAADQASSGSDNSGDHGRP
jgi:hypothetical protein